jgi:hypothetical protein
MPNMRAFATLMVVTGFGAVVTILAPCARADDWSIGIGIGVPGWVVAPPPVYVEPPPVYVAPPPRYYVPPGYLPGYYYPPGYYPPGYYRPPVVVDGGYADG